MWMSAQDEFRDLRQLLARRTWVADRGVRCNRPHLSGKNLGRAFRLANGKFGLFGLANTHISVCLVWPIPIFRSVRSVRSEHYLRTHITEPPFFIFKRQYISSFFCLRNKFFNAAGPKFWDKSSQDNLLSI